MNAAHKQFAVSGLRFAGEVHVDTIPLAKPSLQGFSNQQSGSLKLLHHEMPVPRDLKFSVPMPNFEDNSYPENYSVLALFPRHHAIASRMTLLPFETTPVY